MMQTESNKNSMKNMETQINQMRQRIKKLKQKNRSQQNSARRHQSLASEVIRKKLGMAQQYLEESKKKEAYEKQQARKIQHLKQRNAWQRAKHNNQIDNIMKAVYLVKADDARELRKVSKEHKDKLRQLNNQLFENNRVRRERIRSESGKQQKYWKDKLYRVYLQKHAVKVENEKNAALRNQQFQELQNEEAQLLKNLDDYKLISSRSKRQYVSALSLPIKQVASSLNQPGKKQNGQLVNLERSGKSYSGSVPYNYEDFAEEQVYNLPNTQVNEAKLKIVLEQLRKKKVN